MIKLFFDTIEKEQPGILITGGKAPDFKKVRNVVNSAKYIVAADSGLDTADEWEIRPNKILGDMDSLSDKNKLKQYKKDEVIIYNRDKDLTDTEIGLDLLCDLGIQYPCIIGGGGGRMDHFIGILSLFHRNPSPFLWITHSAMVMEIKNAVRFFIGKGKRVSFFPLGCECTEINSEGLKWSLNNVRWKIGDVGISNETTQDIVSVTIKKGRAILVAPLEELQFGNW